MPAWSTRKAQARQAGRVLPGHVDIIFCHAATYAMSALTPAHRQHCRRPVVVLVATSAAMAYDRTTTGEWLAHCVGCSVPEIASAFCRASSGDW